jgi:3-phytase/alkaline phosphatase D
VFAVLERDDLADDEARIKRVHTVDLSGVVFAPAGTPAAELPVLTKTLARDLLAAGPAGGGEEGPYRQEKAEGLARAAGGTWYVVSDDDGGGETDLRAFGALAGEAAPAPSGPFADLDPQLVGSAVLPGGDVLGTRFGGISGLAFDAGRGVHYAIADDRSEFAPARFYTLRVDLADGAVDPGDVDVLAVTTLRGADGQPFAAGSVDPEGIALTEDGTLLITSEGDAARLVPPFVREFGLDGAQRTALPVPAAFVPALGADGAPIRGVRPNAAFESATVTPDGERFYTGTEGALVQDGPASTPEEGSTTRLLRYDLADGAPDAQFAYPLGPVAAAPVPADAFATTGLVELLATGDDDLLALERSFSTGVGNAVSLYGVSTGGADDVSGLASLAGQDVEPVTKQLLLDLGTLGVTLDNLEGIAPGPALPDGRRSLVVVADDNFSPTQVTQVLVLALG